MPARLPAPIQKLLSKLHTASGGWSTSMTAKAACKKLIEWVSDSNRLHDIDHDSQVVRELLSSNAIKWTDLQKAGVPLLPPMPYSPITHYDRDLVTYVDAYLANPMRGPTDEESKKMVTYTYSHTSYPGISLPALRAAGMLKNNSPSYVAPARILIN